ncbi:hypothetical protein H5410_014346 [Solanum commersonii]|uniref:Uncharacterized protein n=1 Tax=Solanum commersonii TaxID=4109 RepID=A0A9J5ZR36_SOLCO|nr:hypothetical protein H5410_014346 [Solanum commersonii]
MADTLPKNVRILQASFTEVAETKKTKEVIQELFLQESSKSELEPTDSDPEDIGSRSDEYDPSIDQFTLHHDSNEDNELGMSFDFEALHNLDT